MNGIVKHLAARKGFGFIKGDDGTTYFFHKDDFKGFWKDLVYDYITISPQVTFDVTPSPKGPRAANVSRTDFPNQAV